MQEYIKSVLDSIDVKVTGQEQFIKDLTVNQAYGRGILVGIAAALMESNDLDFEEAVTVIESCSPLHIDSKCIPESYWEIFNSARRERQRATAKVLPSIEKVQNVHSVSKDNKKSS